MRNKTPLILALLAGLLGAYILLVERHRPTTDGARAAAERLLPELARSQIAELAIARGGRAGSEERFVIRRPAGVAGPVAGDAWRLAPDDRATDRPTAPGAIDGLLDVVDGLEIDRIADAPAAVSGLDRPAVTLSVTTTAGRRFELRLGNSDASRRGVFVARDGDARTFVIGRRLLDLLDRPATAFRDRRLFPVALGGTAATVGWTAGDEAQRTLRVHDGIWLNEMGLFVPSTAVAQALRELGELKALDFPAPPAAPPGPPTGTLDVSLPAETAGVESSAASGTPRERRWRARFWRGQACSGAAGRLAELTAGDGDHPRQPDWLCLADAEVEHVGRALDLAHQRQLRLLSADAEQIGGASISLAPDDGRRLRLRRERGEWRVVEPADDYAADGDVIAAWLGRLSTVILDARPPLQAVRSAVRRRLIIEGTDGAAIEAIDVAMPGGAMVRVQREGESQAASAPAALYAELDPQPLRFRSRAVLSLARSDAESVEISSAAGRTEARKGPGESWQATAPGAEIDTAALETLLGIFTNLRATNFPSPPPAGFGPERTIEVAFLDSAGLHPQKLELAHATSGGNVYLARVPGGPIFELSPPDYAGLSQPIARTAKTPR